MWSPRRFHVGSLVIFAYINDITCASSMSQFIIFADGTNVFLAERSMDVLVNKINVEL